VAAAGGVPVRLVGSFFMVALAVSVGLSALVVGAILSTALLIGPAACALRIARRITTAIAGAIVIGIGTTWLGILLAYDSYDWAPSHPSVPVSFFIVAIIVVLYLVTGLPILRNRSGHSVSASGRTPVDRARGPMGPGNG
jgi:zinc/manganese transport system permease protein